MGQGHIKMNEGTIARVYVAILRVEIARSNVRKVVRANLSSPIREGQATAT